VFVNEQSVVIGTETQKCGTIYTLGGPWFY